MTGDWETEPGRIEARSGFSLVVGNGTGQTDKKAGGKQQGRLRLPCVFHVHFYFTSLNTIIHRNETEKSAQGRSPRPRRDSN